MLTLRKPSVADVPDMMSLMAPRILAEQLLPRSPRQVVERLREYVLATRHGEVVGLASVSLVDFDLAEVGALAAHETDTLHSLLDHVIDEVRALGVGRAFVLTHEPHVFEARGFSRTSLDQLPQKRDHQCAHCSRAPWCRQVALEMRLDVSWDVAAK